MPVHHSPGRLKDIDHGSAEKNSLMLQTHAPRSSTPMVQRARSPSGCEGDKTLLVDDTGDGDGVHCDRDRGPGGNDPHSEKVVGRLDQDAYRPFGTCSRTSSDTSADMTCCKGGPNNPVCGNEVKDGDMGVQCSTCEQWFHSKCQSISKMAYNALVKHKVLSWHCSNCRLLLGQKVKADAGCRCPDLETKINKLVDVVQAALETVQESNKKTCEDMRINTDKLKDSMEARLEKMEARLEKMEGVMRAHTNLIGDQERMIQHSFKKIQDDKVTYAETVKGSCDAMQKVVKTIEAFPILGKQQSTQPAEKTIAGVFDEFLDKEKRKLNVVLHNVPESQGESFSERTEQDKMKFIEVIRDGMRLNVKVTKAFRVGKSTPEKPRLLIVGLENAEVKIEVLKLASQLRETEKWHDIYITPDLTWKEREEGRRLREELRRRTSAGETNLVIRRGRIISRAGRNDGQHSSGVEQHRGSTCRPVPEPQTSGSHEQVNTLEAAGSHEGQAN